MDIKSVFFCLSLLFCIVISIGAVCAVDVNDTKYGVENDDSLVAIDSDDEVLMDYDDYEQVYFNASVTGPGTGSVDNPYKNLSDYKDPYYKGPYFFENSVLHFANGEYSGNVIGYPMFGDMDLVFIGENCEKTVIDSMSSG